jgi:hypothetical protein
VSIFDYLTPAEAVAASGNTAPGHLRIDGLKGVDADRIPHMITRTAAGTARKPESGRGQDAHGHLDKFKDIIRVEWAKDADPGTAEVFYADGSTDLLRCGDLLCVERPILSTPEKVEANRAKINDESLPIEVRRAAFRLANRHQAATPRRVEGGPYDGQNFATHSVAVWITNDGTFIEDARNAARAGEDELRDHLRPVVFGPRAHRSADDRHTIALIRDSLSEAADGRDASEGFDAINWAYVRAELLAE